MHLLSVVLFCYRRFLGELLGQAGRLFEPVGCFAGAFCFTRVIATLADDHRALMLEMPNRRGEGIDVATDVGVR